MTKRVCGSWSSFDRLTNLPADVIHRILALLPTKDAARTATLSTEWRRHWRRIPRLVFDHGFARSTEQQAGEPVMSIWNEMVKMSKLMFNINGVLLLHDHDAPITNFVLAVPGLRSSHYEREIDKILVHLSNRGGLQVFALAFSADGNQVYKLHSALFSCLELKCLILGGCELRQPPMEFAGFSKLRVLVLREVTLPTDFFENVLLKCPVLQSLFLCCCHGPSSILQLVAPRLERFDFFGYNFQKIYFKHTPLLKSVLIALYSYVQIFEKPVDSAVALFASLPALQRFQLDFQLLQDFGASDDITNVLPTTTLHRIQFATIMHLDFGSLEKARAFVDLIISLPNLLELTIKLRTSNQLADNSATTNIRRWLAPLLVGCCLRHLRVFRIQDCLGTQVELDLVRFVLAVGPLLEKVLIASLNKLPSDTRIKFMENVMAYGQASTKAIVICD